MNRPCAFAVTCPGFDFPFLNASSEALDTLDYLGFGFAYGPGGNIPPLGQNWTVTACGVALFSTTDPNHAQLQAIADAIQCNALGRYPDQPVLTNNQQICCQPGPNGETCYTIENGIIGGQTVAEADQRASALACYFARRTAGRTFKINTPAGGCLNVPYLQDIRPTGGVPPYIISIVAGELPPGVVFHQDDARTGTLDGVPTVAGSYTFTVQVQDIAGNVLLRQDVTVGILAITNPTLPGAVVGTPYLEQILGAGGTPPYLFTTGVGFLPGGLTMDTSGLISGTPVVAADVFFTVTMTDSAGTTCQQQCEINVTDACTPDTGPAVPSTLLTPITPVVVASATVTPANIGGNPVALGPSDVSGSFEIRYASGHFTRDRQPASQPPTQDLYTGYPGGPNQLIIDADGNQFPGTIQPCFSGAVDADTLALNPMFSQFLADPKTFQLHCNLGQITCTSQTVPGSDAGSINYNLVKTGTTNVPARVRVVSYNENAFGIITSCANLGVVIHWDGTLSVRYFPDAFTLRYWPLGSTISSTVPYLIQNSAASIELRFQPNNYWQLGIDCTGGGNIWTGRKLVGTSPVGTYVRIAGSQKAAGPACLHIESY